MFRRGVCAEKRRKHSVSKTTLHIAFAIFVRKLGEIGVHEEAERLPAAYRPPEHHIVVTHRLPDAAPPIGLCSHYVEMEGKQAG